MVGRTEVVVQRRNTENSEKRWAAAMVTKLRARSQVLRRQSGVKLPCDLTFPTLAETLEGQLHSTPSTDFRGPPLFFSSHNGEKMVYLVP
jgi:hypothetical protein